MSQSGYTVIGVLSALNRWGPIPLSESAVEGGAVEVSVEEPRIVVSEAEVVVEEEAVVTERGSVEEGATVERGREVAAVAAVVPEAVVEVPATMTEVTTKTPATMTTVTTKTPATMTAVALGSEGGAGSSEGEQPY